MSDNMAEEEEPLYDGHIKQEEKMNMEHNSKYTYIQ